MKKDEFINYWRGLPVGSPGPENVMRAVPYKHEGSTYDQDGIRLTGTRAFIDSVLVVLKPLLARENGMERLQVVYQQSADRATGVLMDSWNCYIQVHQRGPEAQMLNTFIAGARRGR